ncbi:DUF5362 family protein [Tenacibaculum caenipelagi]|uniref:DUF5362 domain-containing protein n=1 Tax=Tenacibaculum caenipelagi TaxID=1325435 RepID=A0A4R6TH60_9FLAO|nr:DUF5362 family protein [Tenacibaculum caenipelagi]TDQ29785.1 hypothetical protein DFQ07_0105 [Tenacibaculum caenipelagi]
MEENLQVNNSSGIRLNNVAKEVLKEASKWANFLAIIGFIGVGFMVLMALFAGTIFSALPSSGYETVIGGVGFTIIYLLGAALYFFPVMYLYKFAKKTKTALLRNNEEELTEAFTNLKSHYKFIGVLTIVMLSVYAVMFLIAIVRGVAAVSSASF